MNGTDKWSRFDEFIYIAINYIVTFGWIIVIWSPKHNLKLLFTWIGILLIGLIMCDIKSKYKKKNNKKVKNK